MKPLILLLKNLILGGVLFLLPIGIVILVFGKLLGISRKVGEALHASILPGMNSNIASLLIAILVLATIALLAGLFASTGPGRRTFMALERGVLSQLPIYAVLKQSIDDLTGTIERVGEGDIEVVEVGFADYARIGFLVERLEDGRAVVFLPGAPSVLKGHVVIVGADKLRPSTLKTRTVMAAMGRLGAGLGEARAAGP